MSFTSGKARRRFAGGSAALVGMLILGSAAFVRSDPETSKPADTRRPEAQPTQKQPGPFADVPTNHPSYSIIDYLAREAGIFCGYPDGAFSGKRALTRYEFAVAVQRMHQELKRSLKLTDPNKPGAKPAASVGPPAGTSGPEKLAQLLKDPEKLQRALAWYQPLIVEFSSELRLLGTDVEQVKKEAAGWQEDAAEAARGSADQKKADA
jgi:S-layer family protein